MEIEVLHFRTYPWPFSSIPGRAVHEVAVLLIGGFVPVA